MQADGNLASHRTDTSLSLTGIKDQVLPTPVCGITPNAQKCEQQTEAGGQGGQEMCHKRKQ